MQNRTGNVIEQKPSDNDLETRVAQLEGELRETKKSLWEAKEKAATLENIFQALPTPLFYKNMQGVYLNCNKAFAEMKGFFQDDIIGKTVFDVASPERAEGCSNIDAKLQEAGGGCQTYEATIQHKHGKQRDVMFCKAIFPGPDGEPAGVVGLISDITEINRQKNELARLKTKYHTLLETIPHGIVELNDSGEITFTNSAFNQIVGQKQADLEGANFKDLMMPFVDKGYSQGCFSAFLEGGLPSVPCMARVSAPRTKTKDVQIDWSYKRSDNADPVGFILIVTDVTEHNRAAKRLDHYQKRLRSLSSQLSLVEARERRKIATELHDNLGQNLVLAKFKLKSFLAKHSLPECEQEIVSIRESVESAIDFARSLTARVSPLILYNLDLESSIEWLAENILTPCQIDFQIKTDESSRDLTEDAQVLLFETIRELFVNIVKHAQAQNVLIDLMHVVGNLQVCVEDDGQGFEYDSERGLEDDSGFGLFSILERIKYLEGNVSVSSTPNQGTCIRIDVPLQALPGEEKK